MPEAPGLWPLAPGLWALIGLLFLLAIALLWQLCRHYRANAYRRAGLLLLRNAATTYEVNVVLKRVALAVYAREHIAPLHGRQWCEFLNSQAAGTLFPETAFEHSESAADKELKQQARHWIRRHKRTAL